MTASDFLAGNACVVGLQWGDEGKGKIVDYLAEEADVVARYCGGANAGHSVVINGQKHSTHLLPVGVLRPGVVNIIGNGVVLDPEKLLSEIDALNADGFSVTPATLKVSYKAHVVMPWHKLEDAARENAAGADGIGTTLRGIGPAYAEKMHRTSAIRVCDLLRPDTLGELIRRVTKEKNRLFAAMYASDPPIEAIDAEKLLATSLAMADRIRPFIADTGHLLIESYKGGKKILFEGAHAALLDVDHGTYPYVTSSNCSSAGLYAGSGVPPQTVRQFIGIMKAYSTRVGGGPFPTEQNNAIGDGIRDRGNEYGTTTRRPRRIGWFDAPAVRYAADLCGATSIALTLLDVLSGLEEVRVCTGYELDANPLDYYRADADTLALVRPVYQTLDGWAEDISAVRSYNDLPGAARKYVERLEDLIGVPISMVSVGPDRSATLMRERD